MTTPPYSPDSGPEPATAPDPPAVSADDELVSASLDGETTPAEEERLAADPVLVARRRELAAVRAAVAAPPPLPSAAARDAAIGAALDAATVIDLASRHRAASRWSKRLPLGLAAGVLLLLGVLGVVALNRSGGGSENQLSSAVATAAGDAAAESTPAAVAGAGTSAPARATSTAAPSAAGTAAPTTAAPAPAPATTVPAPATTAPVQTTIASGLPDAPVDSSGTSPPTSGAPGADELVDLGAVDDEITVRNASVGLLPRPPAEVGVACPAPVPSAGAAARLVWQGTPAVLFLSVGDEGTDDTAIVVADGSCAVLATISLAA